MAAIVVYESVYGNTRQVAEAVAAGLGEARVLSVQEAVGHVSTADLLIVGGPTHIHGMTTSRSRSAAAQKADPNAGSAMADEPGLRDWLADLPRIINAQAAAFDTRLHGSSLLTGSASHGIARRLRRHGYRVVGTASFVVTEGEGPLAEGELERAREWGAQLAKSQAAAGDRGLG
jgi:Flavodoxin domain